MCSGDVGVDEVGTERVAVWEFAELTTVALFEEVSASEEGPSTCGPEKSAISKLVKDWAVSHSMVMSFKIGDEVLVRLKWYESCKPVKRGSFCCERFPMFQSLQRVEVLFKTPETVVRYENVKLESVGIVALWLTHPSSTFPPFGDKVLVVNVPSSMIVPFESTYPFHVEMLLTPPDPAEPTTPTAPVP